MMSNATILNDTLVEEFNRLTWRKIVVATILYIITLMTIVGNILVLVAFKINKKLQTTFNYYIVNLAITDIAVAVTAMSFQATHTILGYWPFGEAVCALWIFFDYGMTFVSVFTLLLISADRFWSIKWSVHYRSHHTKKKCRIAILLAWVFMLVLWIPSWCLDRIRYSKPGECFWDPSLNNEFVYIIAVFGHHCPYFMIMTFYILLFKLIRQRAKVDTLHYHGNPSSSRQDLISSTTSGHIIPSTSEHITCFQIVKPDIQGLSKLPPICHVQSTSQNITAQAFKRQTKLITIGQVSEIQLRRDKDRKVFISLTYIILAYGVLWLPFHVVFDISIVDPSLIPEQILNMSFWMAYCNSTINPLLYNFSNVEFRTTFKRLLCGCFCN